MDEEKIAIVADSGSDVPQELIDQYGIHIASLKIIFKDGEYLDRVDISTDEVYQRLENEIPSTSLPSGEDIKDIYLDLKEAGYTKAIVISISSGLSGTANIFNLVSQDVEDLEVEVIDTKSIGVGSGIFAAFIGERIQAGDSFEDIVSKSHQLISQSRVFFSIPTLKYLEAGGRIGKVTSLVGGLLKVNPVISCNEEGIYYTLAKARGRVKGLKKLKECVLAFAEGSEKYNIAVAYGSSENRSMAENLLKEIEASLDHVNQSYISSVSPALGVHTGPDLIGATIQCFD